MNCFYHENAPAVATCCDCGVGLCKECVQNALYTRDNRPICLNCSKKEATAQASGASNEVAVLQKRLVICIVIFFVGIGAYFYNSQYPWAYMIGVWCLANIGRALVTIFRPVNTIDEALSKHKSGGEWFMGRLLGGVIVALFWGVFLPIQILWIANQLQKAKKEANALHENAQNANNIQA